MEEEAAVPSPKGESGSVTADERVTVREQGEPSGSAVRSPVVVSAGSGLEYAATVTEEEGAEAGTDTGAEASSSRGSKAGYKAWP